MPKDTPADQAELLVQFHEAVRRLTSIEAYVTTGTQTQMTADIAKMASKGSWARPIKVDS